MKFALAALAVVLLCAPVALADTDSKSTFTYGSGATFMQVIVSSHGNVWSFQSPEGAEHIAAGDFIEGYAICSDGVEDHGFDIGELESGFGAATIVQPNGANTLPLTITRSTEDGKFSLKQTFARDFIEKDFTVTMILRNTSGVTITGVKLARTVDQDIDASNDDDVFTRTNESIDAIGPGGNGLVLEGVSKVPTPTTQMESFQDWVDPDKNTCGMGRPQAIPYSGDGVSKLVYNLGDMKKNTSKTVKIRYRRH